MRKFPREVDSKQIFSDEKIGSQTQKAPSDSICQKTYDTGTKNTEEDFEMELKRKFNGVFECHDYLDENNQPIVYEYSKTSLYCMTD